MTPSQLKYHYEKNNPGGLFFTRGTMKFFGDTMRNYGCYESENAWVLWRKRPVKNGLRSDATFCKRTFRRIT